LDGIKKFITGMFLYIGFSAVMGGIAVFFVGFHNVDLSVNIMRISYFENLNYSRYVDRTINDKIITYDDGYIIGLRQQIAGLLISLWGTLMFATCLGSFRYGR
jgi:hypothetical protein